MQNGWRQKRLIVDSHQDQPRLWHPSHPEKDQTVQIYPQEIKFQMFKSLWLQNRQYLLPQHQLRNPFLDPVSINLMINVYPHDRLTFMFVSDGFSSGTSSSESNHSSHGTQSQKIVSSPDTTCENSLKSCDSTLNPTADLNRTGDHVYSSMTKIVEVVKDLLTGVKEAQTHSYLDLVKVCSYLFVMNYHHHHLLLVTNRMWV